MPQLWAGAIYPKFETVIQCPHYRNLNARLGYHHRPSHGRTLTGGRGTMYATEMGIYISEMCAAQDEGITIVLPNGISATSAYFCAAEQALKLASALSDKLGLNPNARHRLKGEAAFRDEKPEEESFILKLMREAREKD